ncbi:DUF4251 domain-containing protein [Flavobacterium sp. TAB 87]|uniref:DUF4251 domain-containing protein n=1 Tax=Flavobacterium sp. TAB 87 TaxID=1729581 RepID=UPI00076C96D7|nr:DUF4251 domain-containing protein [Flavobacterium sp. TAB 87]KVV14066.1 hypothetical protein AP058_01952 [Flavobacterium sp. TAB 87]
MKNKFRLLVFVFFILINSNNAQEKTKRVLKDEQRGITVNQITDLINSQNFVFYARFVEPMASRHINVEGENYTVTYTTDLVESYLPYFGRAYSIGYGGDGGLKFKGKSESYTVEKKKKYYLISTTVKGENDTFRLTLSVYFEGSATLVVSSNNRSTISYTGEIQALSKSE